MPIRKKSENLSYAPGIVIYLVNSVIIVYMYIYVYLYRYINRPIGLVGRVFHQWSGRSRFNPRSRHTKDFKNGT